MLKMTHLILGILLLMTFLFTGKYMDVELNHLRDMSLFSRMSFRAGHIYILFYAFIHISLGKYLKPSESIYRELLQKIGSIFLIGASILCVSSFFIDLPTETIERPLARYSIYLSLAGIIFHLIHDIKFKRK